MVTTSKLEVPEALQSKWETLLTQLAQLGSAVVGFSGGVDSSLLSVAAYQALGDKMLAVTIKTPVETSGTMDVAASLARQFHFPHKVIEFNDLADEKFVSNPADRCYHCKKMDFGIIWKEARQANFKHVLDGSNADDVTDYRPGRKAAEELEVLSPLLQAGFKKDDIRQIAKALGMANWDRPSSPCLASRFPYGTRITQEGLEKVAAGEEFLHQQGFRVVRVRYGGANVRLEVSPQEISRLIDQREDVVKFFKGLGFKYVLIDLEGYRQGSLNEVLPVSVTAR
jgi:pyridinium-3,5-biscarboxylic acid mononucleotide sulfurtransferase